VLRAVALGLIAFLLACAYIAWRDNDVRIERSASNTDGGYVTLYRDPAPGLESAMAAGDGQAFGAIARDPTMSRPEVFRAGPADAAYRWQRPLLGYMTYLVSLGQARWEPRAQAIAVAMGAGVAVAAIALMLIARSVSPVFALGVLVSPGVLSAMDRLTAETWMLAFLSIGLLVWQRHPRSPIVAAIAFSFAVLARETALVAVVALLIVEVTRRNRDTRLAKAVRNAWPLAVPVLTYAAWSALLRARLGAWPTDAHDGRLSIVPLRGLLRQADHFAQPRQTFLWLAVAILFCLYALLRARSDQLTPIVTAYGVFALFVGALVWDFWGNFGRALEPLYAYGLVIVATAVARTTRERALPVETEQRSQEPAGVTLGNLGDVLR
jgi:hypothetical protein